MFSFHGEKLLREARKRDFLRSRLPAGRRWKSEDEAEVLTQKTLDDQNTRQKEHDRQDKNIAYDGAMETATNGCRRDMSIKSFVI